MKQRYVIVIATLIVALLTCSAVLAGAGTSGKIAGIVEDHSTGQPLVGATVQVEGQNLVTTTDEDGEYFLIGVPIGRYNMVVTHVGYASHRKEEVRILVDLTTPVNFALETAPVDLGRDVVVRATNPVIQADLTSSRSIFTAERLASLPNTISVQSVLTSYPGVVIGKEADMHVRGGRAGQISYNLDGFSVDDPFTSDAGLRIMPSSLEELSLITGGFTAEYGNAMSGIVNAVTREGGRHYQGRVRAYEGFTKPYDVNTGEWLGMRRRQNRSLSFDLSGPIPGVNPDKVSFLAVGEYLRNNTYLPHNWEISYTGLAKLVMKPTPKLKLVSNFEYYVSDGDLYEHRDVNAVSYDFNLDGLPAFEKNGYLAGVSGNYAINESFIVSLGVNRFTTSTLESPRNLLGKHWSEWPGYSEDSAGNYNGTIHETNYLNEQRGDDPGYWVGFTSGDDFDPSYRYREANYNAINSSFQTQITKSNQLKAGFEYRRYEIDRDFKQFYNNSPYTERYTSNPKYVTVYMQDKLEYDYFVMNLGLRFDYRNNDIAYNLTARQQGSQSLNPEDDVYKQADASSYFSPRMGVSFPISEKSVMHFNYGVYHQVPLYGHLFFNLEGETMSGLPLFGNPDLDPERTVSYELGLDHLIGNSLRFDVTAYFKDVSDLVTTRPIGDLQGDPVTAYVNGDYGSVEGVDITLEKLRDDGIVSGSVSYSYMMAVGNATNANEAYHTWITNPGQTAPTSEYPLDFDQRHTVTAVLDCQIPRGWDGRFFGLKMPDAWGITMIGYYGSGLPYTKVNADGDRLGDRNEGRLPVTYSVDARFIKNLYFGRKDYFLTLFVEVDNLFDRRNIFNVYNRTGLPDDDNNSLGSGLVLDADEVNRLDRLFDHDPQNYSPPRTIRTGLEFNF